MLVSAMIQLAYILHIEAKLDQELEGSNPAGRSVFSFFFFSFFSLQVEGLRSGPHKGIF